MHNRQSGDAPRTISIVICTHNRAGYLSQAIESVINQPLPGDEIIVVDNGSTDKTRLAVQHFEGRSNIRYVFEPKLGLCHARNTGWRNANGQYVAYLDDDAVASPGWLGAIRDAFTMMPSAGAVGGRVEPIWLGKRPDWLSDEIAMSLTIVDWSNQPKAITDIRTEWLVGANIAFPAKVLAELGGFEPRLGRAGRNLLSGEEIFIQNQIIQHGYSCLYYPQMAVRHLVHASRLNKQWFRRRYYWQGISDAVMYCIQNSPSGKQRLLHALCRARRLFRSPQRFRDFLVSTDDPERFMHMCFLLIEIGYVAALFGLARR